MSSKELSELHYVIISRNGLIEMKNSKKFQGYEFDINYSFKAEPWMVPEAQLLIYYIHHSGEIIYDLITLLFDDSLPNYVSNFYGAVIRFPLLTRTIVFQFSVEH